MPKRITILRAERSRGYESDGLTLELDARRLTTEITTEVAEHHRKAIRAGQEPSGGSQKGLGPDERKRASKGKRNSQRGMGQAGRFPASIGTRVSGGDLKATGEVAADAFYDDWQGREARRGVEYFEVDGDVEKVLDAVLEAELKRQGFK